MQLTGKEIIQQGIVFNYDQEKAVQQQGVDVRVDNIYRLIGNGHISNKSIIPSRQVMPSFEGMFILDPGYYEIDLMEGVNVPNNATLHFKTRSSLVRCGAIVHSGQFDAGFNTENAGCFLHVIRPVTIERGSRIAQAIVFTSNEVENLYDGQFQNDKQRK